jgi:hypothetical protein
MELFGIALSIPGAFLLSMIYCFVLKKVISRFYQVNLSFRVGSYIVLALFGLEVVFLITWGAVRSRGIFGPGFYVVHLLCFFLGTPALANLLVLRRRGGSIAKWYLAPILCTAFAFSLVLLQMEFLKPCTGSMETTALTAGNMGLRFPEDSSRKPL